ncbi:MAG: TetR/AcrR family transcriptional regulator [Planctomycetota bacterium]|nr:MAG: TetR/AcrR family transcriptional regulator [Planctomycetota bacterium]
MPRPNKSQERRTELVPILARTFADLGYRRTTTAELAGRCGVRENILYRLWPDKRAMFVAALDFVYEVSEATWDEILAQAEDGTSPAELILDHESTHHGEFGLYRIVFAGLSETDDPEIAKALKRLYGRFQRFIHKQVKAHREGHPEPAATDPALVAWAIVGLGTVANIGRELGLLSASARKRLVGEVGRALLGESGGRLATTRAARDRARVPGRPRRAGPRP